MGKGSDAYRKKPIGVDSLCNPKNGWTVASSSSRLSRMVDVQKEMSNFELRQVGLGQLTGNVCGYVAAARLAKFYSKSSPSVSKYPSTHPWTTPKMLRDYFSAIGWHCEHQQRSSSEYQDYVRSVRKFVTERQPVTVLFNVGGWNMHYVIVVAFKGHDFVVADYGGFYVVNAAQFERNSYNPIPLMSAYNVIVGRPKFYLTVKNASDSDIFVCVGFELRAPKRIPKGKPAYWQIPYCRTNKIRIYAGANLFSFTYSYLFASAFTVGENEPVIHVRGAPAGVPSLNHGYFDTRKTFTKLADCIEHFR